LNPPIRDGFEIQQDNEGLRNFVVWDDFVCALALLDLSFIQTLLPTHFTLFFNNSWDLIDSAVLGEFQSKYWP